MQRRHVPLHLGGLAAAAMGLPAAGPAHATGAAGPAGPAGAAPTEGEHYVRLAQPLPPASDGRTELVEFFWYGCPHCHELEPLIGPWARQQPATVRFTRQHIGGDAYRRLHQQLYFSLDALGQAERVQAQVFARFHVARQPLKSESEILAFVPSLGLDAKAFAQAWGSFGVRTRMQRADTLASSYRIQGVPTLGVGGRYQTSPVAAGGNVQALRVADYLVSRVRTGA